MIGDLRLLSHQLANPHCRSPKELVSWMGALQAQNYPMSKWAMGIRLPASTIRTVDKAIHCGEIIRIHVLRPTWHWIPQEDVRWMLALSKRNIQSALKFRNKNSGITDNLCIQCNRMLEKILAGHTHLTRQEIYSEFNRSGVNIHPIQMTLVMMQAEIEGIICSGIDKNNQWTYALLEERIFSTSMLSQDEALAKLATKFFQSHSPASLYDFAWWSGLTRCESKKAIDLIAPDLVRDKRSSPCLWTHTSCGTQQLSDTENLHLLPSYDEYLIAYRDRTHVIDTQHQHRAFNAYGTFHPVVLYNGQVVGTWTQTTRRAVRVFPFHSLINMPQRYLQKAINAYKRFMTLETS
ncbi:MAG: winged helix DNA-binding domain-containing protein [Puniceicoccales bacterium]|jgi:hypothetical protein|nr:winged helix DNA-binding domain-containing protein [Puniceicoccales bacterium]